MAVNVPSSPSPMSLSRAGIRNAGLAFTPSSQQPAGDGSNKGKQVRELLELVRKEGSYRCLWELPTEFIKQMTLIKHRFHSVSDLKLIPSSLLHPELL